MTVTDMPEPGDTWLLADGTMAPATIVSVHPSGALLVQWFETLSADGLLPMTSPFTPEVPLQFVAGDR